MSGRRRGIVDEEAAAPMDELAGVLLDVNAREVDLFAAVELDPAALA
jgi:hypothetical protein